MKGLLLSAPSSNAGKTVITLALLRALKQRGLAIQPVKCGPDYIDPHYHSLASGEESFNIDLWGMRSSLIKNLINQSQAHDLLVAEGMMGLFDGAASGQGSSADIAKELGLPIILILDCAKQSQSIAAVVYGFQHFKPDIKIAGLILNRVGSPRHEAMLRAALADSHIPILGALPRLPDLVLPARHLGLVQAGEHKDIESFIANSATIVAKYLDLDLLMAVAMPIAVNKDVAKAPPLAPLGQHIAIAKDQAFSFIYRHILMGWQSAGAQLSFFSPLADEAPAKEADAVYLPGGYPELYGSALAGAAKFKCTMQEFAGANKVIYGECGGYMVLGRSIEDDKGAIHPMLGLLPVETSFKQKKMVLGYRHLKPAPNGFWPCDLKGHEYHYSQQISPHSPPPLFVVYDSHYHKLGAIGMQQNNVFGSYIHVMDYA